MQYRVLPFDCFLWEHYRFIGDETRRLHISEFDKMRIKGGKHEMKSMKRGEDLITHLSNEISKRFEDTQR